MAGRFRLQGPRIGMDLRYCSPGCLVYCHRYGKHSGNPGCIEQSREKPENRINVIEIKIKTMFQNYLKIAIRNLWKNKGFSTINILGLAIGIATCLLITLYVLDELSFDRYHEKSDRIYRLNVDLRFGGGEQKFAVGPDPLAFTMVELYPQVENAVRFRGYGSYVVKKGNQNIKEERIIFVDSTLFDVFTLPMIAGEPRTALAAPYSVVITESIAKKYFNKTDVVGQSRRFDNTQDYKV